VKTLQLADSLTLPAVEAVTQKYGFIGRSGSGKSYAAMKLAELFLGAGAQIIALDWVGIWWSLRLAANGKAPGFEHVYIFGGEHADVDLRPESGALMADLVVDKHISVVLDVMHFRKAERTRFATAFAEQFFHRKKTARTACHLFIEEAQAYLPQMVRGEEARMVGVFEDIGKVGRNYGIGNSLISQRPQAINKDVLNQVEVLLAFQTNGPQERKAIAGWTAENTDAGAAMMQELPKLHVGQALVWSPQWLRVAEQVTSRSATPTTRARRRRSRRRRSGRRRWRRRTSSSSARSNPGDDREGEGGRPARAPAGKIAGI
jgi:DNA helicase HerA-like ATPase